MPGEPKLLGLKDFLDDLEHVVPLHLVLGLDRLLVDVLEERLGLVPVVVGTVRVEADTMKTISMMAQYMFQKG